MKYIIWPFLAIFLLLVLIIVGFARMLALTIWHARIYSIRKAFTLDGDYIFEDCSLKQCIREIFICPQSWSYEETNDDDD